jgi:hypothetical protein
MYYQVGKYCAENNKAYTMNLSAPFLCRKFKKQVGHVKILV